MGEVGSGRIVHEQKDSSLRARDVGTREDEITGLGWNSRVVSLVYTSCHRHTSFITNDWRRQGLAFTPSEFSIALANVLIPTMRNNCILCDN